VKIRYKSLDEIRKLREANLVVAEVLDVLCAAVQPGMSTWDLDQIARREIDRHRVKSAFLGYYEYPAVLCTSINEVVVHGIPRKNEVLKDGDIIGIDFGIFKHGFCADTARTVLVGNVSEEKRKLVDAAREALEAAINLCTPGSTWLFGSPSVRRPRHRPADARGPAGAQFWRCRQRQTHENRSCHRR
jgi:methionyl aminopeptidase